MEPISVILNVYNEAGTIEGEIRDIHRTIVSHIPGSEIIVAEDGSKDGTTKIIERLVSEVGVRHSTGPERKGYARAFRDAVALARNEWIFFSDTGGKNNFADFWKLCDLRDGADLVIGARTGRNDQFYRRVLSSSYSFMLRLYFGLEASDADSGFRLYRTALLKEIVRQDWINKDLISSEIAVRLHAMGGRIREVPIEYRQRAGVSRGLPLDKIPKVILRVVGNMPKLRAAARKLAQRGA